MNTDLKMFMKINCNKCKEICDKGIVETKDYIKCIDRDIILDKKYTINYEETRRILLKLNISSNCESFDYILQAITLIYYDYKIKVSDIYKIIGEKEKKKSGAIERTIRYAIQKSFKKNKNIQEIYGGCPTNGAFLYDLLFNKDIFYNKCFN